MCLPFSRIFTSIFFYLNSHHYLYFRGYELAKITQIVWQSQDVRLGSQAQSPWSHLLSSRAFPPAYLHIPAHSSTLFLIQYLYSSSFLIQYLYFQPFHSEEGEMKERAWASPDHLLYNIHLANAKALDCSESLLSVGMGNAEHKEGTYFLHLVVLRI